MPQFCPSLQHHRWILRSLHLTFCLNEGFKIRDYIVPSKIPTAVFWDVFCEIRLNSQVFPAQSFKGQMVVERRQC